MRDLISLARPETEVVSNLTHFLFIYLLSNMFFLTASPIQVVKSKIPISVEANLISAASTYSQAPFVPYSRTFFCLLFFQFLGYFLEYMTLRPNSLLFFFSCPQISILIQSHCFYAVTLSSDYLKILIHKHRITQNMTNV